MRTFIHAIRLRRNSVFCRAMTGIVTFCFGMNVLANPTGMHVRRGSVTAQQNGSQLTVTASDNAFINWQGFNISAGETMTFVQPSSTSIVWNRINDQNPSQIYGNLNANGVVVLLNSSGFYFGPNAHVSAAGLVVSTANCAPPENGGGTWEFNGPPPLASIINYGRISVGQNGSAFLIADHIENHGTIEAPGGTIGLAAGQTVLLSERPDGRGMSLQVTLPQGSVDNYGNLIADAGTIALNAKVMNQDGLIQANSVRTQNGVIELVASDSLTLGAGSQIIARGDDSSPGSAGGSVTIQSGNNFSDNTGGKIILTGGAQGGNGGNLEVSAPNIWSLNSSMDAGAQDGWLGGMFLIDPANIILGTTGSGTVPANGTVDSGSNPGSTLSLNVNTAFLNKNFSLIKLQATANITVNAGTVWDLSASTGLTSGQLILQAGGNIIFGSTTSAGGARITDANNWSVTLAAGYNFANNTVQSGVGNIFLNGGSGQSGSGFIRTAAGSINLTAGQGIFVGKGFINTTGGGNITAHALAGNIDAGSFAQGYGFQSASTPSQAYFVDFGKGLGGISTAAGGNVSLTAGGNVSTVLPGNNGYFYNGTFIATGGTVGTAGSGAYGPQAGNVTVIAGGDVTGQYLVANGIGSIYAGVLMDILGNPVIDSAGKYALGATGNAGSSSSKPNLALSLVKGGWNVTAAQNINLQEVRNPNGDFNVNSGAAFHYFDYAPDAYVELTAGNQVQLGASSSALPRADNLKVPVVYAPILNVSAGAGGVILTGDSTFNQLILFASPQGSLSIKTTDGGSLIGKLDSLNGTPQIFSLIVSDSSKKQYNRSSGGIFGLNDHAATPVHSGHATPITLDLSGDMNLVLLGSPEAAQIKVGGNLNNSRFQGMNLSSGDVSSIHVTGDINNRSAFTSVDLDLYPGTAAPNLSYLAQSLISSPSVTTLVNSFYYDAKTGLFTYQNIPGQSVASVLNLLQNLTVQVYVNGVPQWTDDLHTIPLTETVAVINAATAQAMQAKYDLDNIVSGLPAGTGPPSSAAGYTLGGGGKFDITARNIDLGTTAGIQSVGVGLYQIGASFPLASLFDKGADISVTTKNLEMFSSSIASLNGGSIYVNASGQIDVGSSQFTVNTDIARGIFSTSGSDVSVYATHDINLNGSRIAAFDGGNVTVESFFGDINAGSGGLGGVTLTAYYVDPVTHVVYQNSPTAFGSGILAETFGPRGASYPVPVAQLGNLLVETPNGNVNANSAGVTQLAFNHQNYPDATVAVLAGYEMRDALGQPVSAANIGQGTAVEVSAGKNINAANSGVIAENAILKATGNIDGAIFAKGNIDVAAVNNANVTALAQGTVTASAGDTLSGTIVGIGGISASGGSVDATLLSNGAISGGTSGQTGFAQGTAANATATAASNEANQTADQAATGDGSGEDDLKKKKPISLAQKVGRVTVILPTKTN